MNKNWILTKRRTFLLGLGALASMGAFTISGRFRHFNNQSQAIDREGGDFSVSGDAPLRERAAAKGLIYGAYTEGGYNKFSNDPQFRSTFIQECGLLVAGFHWKVTHAKNANTFDFKDTDYFAKFASEHKMIFRGHPLVWFNSSPQWLIDKFKNPNTTSGEIENILKNHISTVVKRYAGKVHSWDVVNEAINVGDGRADGLRDTQISGVRKEKYPTWLNFLGPDYIDIAFRTAAEADPQALLVYNDYGLDYDTQEDTAKRMAVLKLLERLKSKGTPVHALGLQGHLLRHGKETDFNPKKLKAFLRDVASLGLKIMVTEMDVTDENLPGDFAVRDRIIARNYENYLEAVLEEPATIAVVTWGLSDRYTWLANNRPRKDKMPVRPLPFDATMKRKLAWNAIARAFDKAPKRKV